MKRYFIVLLTLVLAQGCTQFTHTKEISLLDKILTTKVLRVGTTGDYPPFSYLNANSEFEGIDIDLAKDLAFSLKVEVKFVKTSWPTLLEDLEANNYDIAMSGISKKLDRQKVGFFSKGYYTSGKTPISNCDDKDKYTNLNQIDQSNVRVIVNPGGTNHTFANKTFKKATIVLHNDNTTIFDQIKIRKADVMITDSVEVQLQSKLSPELCPTMPGKTFDKSEIAYLMPRDIVWKEYVNAWLVESILNGKVKEIFTKHL